MVDPDYGGLWKFVPSWEDNDILRDGLITETCYHDSVCSGRGKLGYEKEWVRSHSKLNVSLRVFLRNLQVKES